MTPVDPNYPDRDPRDPNRPVEPVRERTERRTIIREPRTGGNGAAFGVGALIVLLIVAIGGFLWWNSRHANPNGPGANPASNDMTTPTPGAGYGGGDNGGNNMTGNNATPGAGGYGIAEGSFNDEQSAVNERQRLNSLTDQPVTMTQTTENGAPVYRVVIGNFATQAQADSAGRTLSSTASLSNWKVVPIQQ